VRALPRIPMKGDVPTETSAPRLQLHFTPEPGLRIKAFWARPYLLKGRLAAELTMKLPRRYRLWPERWAEPSWGGRRNGESS
jgi:hypothetical protein